MLDVSMFVIVNLGHWLNEFITCDIRNIGAFVQHFGKPFSSTRSFSSAIWLGLLCLFACLPPLYLSNAEQFFFFIHRKPIHLRLFLSGTQSKLYVRMEEHIVAGEGPSSYGATEKCATINLLLWRPLWVVWVFVQSSQTKKLSIEEMFPCMC